MKKIRVNVHFLLYYRYPQEHCGCLPLQRQFLHRRRGSRTWPSRVCFCPARNAFSSNDLELAVNYTAKKSYCRRAVELTCKYIFLIPLQGG